MSKRMSGVFRFNIIAASSCVAYYLWSRYTNSRSLQAEYCTKALELVQQYPDVKQILGKNIRLTKLVSNRDKERFTDLSNAESGTGRVRVKCKISGTKADGSLYVWASRSATTETAVAASKFGDDNMAQTQMATIFDPAASAKPTPAEWTIDKLSLLLEDKRLNPHWTLYQSFASLKAAANESTKQTDVDL